MNRLLKIFSIIFFIGCSETNRTEVIEQYPDGSPKSVKEYFNKSDNNYILKDYYENGTLQLEGKIENNKFIEYRKLYYENGNLKEILELADSAGLDYCCPDGFYKYFYENGQLKETHYKIDGKFNGLVIKYDSTGNKFAEYQVKNGLKNGTTKIYYDNGNLYSVRFYEDNIMYGTVYYFNQNGDSLKTNASINGKEDFPTKKWLNNGQVFYATYTDTTHNKVQYLWTDSLGKEIKKIQIVWGQKSEYISEDSWIMPN